MTMEPKYRWNNAHEWLMEYAAKLDAAKLFQEFSVIAGKLDSDTIQDLYQSEMDADGYFDEVLEEGFVEFIHAADYTTRDVQDDPELKARLYKEWQEPA